MNIFKLELKKTNIKPYFFYSVAIFICIMGFMYITAWVPHLNSGDKNATILFSTYQGISAISNIIALISFSVLASAMAFRYVTKEYCGGATILLFSYPMPCKSVVWAKTGVILFFISIMMFLTTFGSFVTFSVTDYLLGMVNDTLQFGDFTLAFRNALVLVCLVDGIALCATRIGFIRKSNSTTIIVSVIISMLLANPVAAINDMFLQVLFLAAAVLLVGGVAMLHLANTVNSMEV